MKKIAIIGAGFTALSLAWDLSHSRSQEQLEITIYDQQDRAGGLVTGFKQDAWDWSIEDHYHHVFASDQVFVNFLHKTGLSQQLFYRQALTKTYYQGQAYQLDSVLSLLRFPHLSILNRLRMGLVLAYLKLIPDGRVLEKYLAADSLKKWMGQEAWSVVWQPLFQAKFGDRLQEVNLAWFWARVKPRTAQLGYFKGGFQQLANQLVDKLTAKGVKWQLQSRVKKIQRLKTGQLRVTYQPVKAKTKTSQANFDLVINTLPAPLFRQISDVPEAQTPVLEGMAAMTLLLRLKQPLLADGTYWLNINQAGWPFVAVVEHDNLVDRNYYHQESLVYLGRYLPINDEAYQLTAKQLYQQYLPFLRQLNPQVEDLMIDYRLSKAPFAQPLIKLNHSQHLPSMRTSDPNLYWVSMQHIYPFDRGINYAIASAEQLYQVLKADLAWLN